MAEVKPMSERIQGRSSRKISAGAANEPFPSEPLVSMEGIGKIFFGAYANKDVDFDLREGEVHALLGENGAGKTTLMNVLTGIYAPDAGHIRVRGRNVRFLSPRDAIACGIGMVHQHFMLVPVLSVWENMILGMPDVPMVLDKKGTIGRIRALSERYGLAVDPEAKIWQLSIGEQQRVEILKMLYRGTKVLILDEPTSVLTPQEVLAFFATLRRMTEAGHGIVLISHKIEEILAISNRLTVLRKGRKIGTVGVEGATPKTLAEMMVGRALKCVVKGAPAAGSSLLSCRSVSARNDRNTAALKDVSFDLRAGEILGLAGVAGNGQGELCEVLSGLRKADSGEILLEGRNLAGLPPREFIRGGISYIPVDRKSVGLVPNMSLTENIALKQYWRTPAAVGKIFLDWRYLGRLTQALMGRFDVAAPSAASPVRTLSGGNLQKLMLARELHNEPTVILAMHPVWGVDVGATEFVHEMLLRARERRAGILLISEDLDELFEFSDRMMVISRGEIMDIIERPCDVSKEEVGLLMAGEGSARKGAA